MQSRVPEAAFEQMAAEGMRMIVQHIRDVSQVGFHALEAECPP